MCFLIGLCSYANTFKLLKDLDLPEWPLTDYTTSGFWSPKGLTTEAPVFSKLPRLPTLVGQFVVSIRALASPDSSCLKTSDVVALALAWFLMPTYMTTQASTIQACAGLGAAMQGLMYCTQRESHVPYVVQSRRQAVA